MTELERLLKQETIDLLKCAESIMRMNEAMAGMIASNHPEIKKSMEDSTSILSQVLQSLEDTKEESKKIVRPDPEYWR